MNCKIEKSNISGKIVCPANKSYTHRAVFLASLAGESNVENILHSADTKATIEACKKFGAEIEENKDSIRMKKPITSGTDSIIDAANSGTTIRIATAIASLFNKKTILTGDESLKRRPMQPILDALETLGAKCSSTEGKPPIEITGKINGGEVTIPGDISSQFISALFIVGPLTEKGVTVIIEGELVSKPYLDATVASMKKFNVQIKEEKSYKKYFIAPQKYKSTNFVVPSDFSSLALLLSAAVLVGDNFSIEIKIEDLPQGDKEFLEILRKLNVEVITKENEISIKSPEILEGGEFDLSNTPDLLPPLAILSLNSKSIKIFNVKHARFKETDRIAILSRELTKLGINVKENEDGLELSALEKVSSAELNSEHDHRLFMAFCIAGMYIGNCTVSDAESVEVSYPDFVSVMKNAGAKINLIP